MLNALEIGVDEKWLAWEMVLHIQDDCPEKKAKNLAHFCLKMDHRMAPRCARHLIDHHLQSFHCLNAMEEEQPSSETPT